MGARELGDLCEAERRARGWSLARVAYEIGLIPPGDKALNESQAKRILEGRRGLDRWMVERLIAVFDLDPNEAWAAAGLTPHGFKPEHFRRLAFFTADAMTHKPGNVALRIAPELEDTELLHRLGVPPPKAERRQRDRRHLRLLPPIVAEKVPA